MPALGHPSRALPVCADGALTVRLARGIGFFFHPRCTARVLCHRAVRHGIRGPVRGRLRTRHSRPRPCGRRDVPVCEGCQFSPPAVRRSRRQRSARLGVFHFAESPRRLPQCCPAARDEPLLLGRLPGAWQGVARLSRACVSHGSRAHRQPGRLPERRGWLRRFHLPECVDASEPPFPRDAAPDHRGHRGSRARGRRSCHRRGTQRGHSPAGKHGVCLQRHPLPTLGGRVETVPTRAGFWHRQPHLRLLRPDVSHAGGPDRSCLRAQRLAPNACRVRHCGRAARDRFHYRTPLARRPAMDPDGRPLFQYHHGTGRAACARTPDRDHERHRRLPRPCDHGFQSAHPRKPSAHRVPLRDARHPPHPRR